MSWRAPRPACRASTARCRYAPDRRTEVPQARVRFVGHLLHQRRCEPRLANARLAGQKHYLAFSAPCLCPMPQQYFDLFIATNELGKSAGVQSLETAFD